MPRQTIENRVERLELRVTELEKLPERITAVESQIVQLRTEMRDEFSAVRQDLEETRRSLRTEIAETRESLGAEIEGLRRSTGEQFDELRRHMRVLHQDVIGRLEAIQEGQSPKRRRRSKPGDN